MSITRFAFRKLALSVAGSLLCAGAALAADADTRYRQEMAVCNSGQSNQDAATCREEARNAAAEMRRGSLSDAPGQYQQNAAQRCGALSGDDRSDCESRMRGEGSVSGSVAGGGVLRETVTIVPGK